MWTTKYITRKPELVVDELEYNVKTYGVTNFPFQDLTAIIQKKWIVAFCEEIIKRDLTLNEIFDLDFGETATRECVGGEWKRMKESNSE